MRGCISHWQSLGPTNASDTLAPFLCPQTKQSGWTVNVWSGRNLCASGCSQASPLVERPFRNARGGQVKKDAAKCTELASPGFVTDRDTLVYLSTSAFSAAKPAYLTVVVRGSDG